MHPDHAGDDVRVTGTGAAAHDGGGDRCAHLFDKITELRNRTLAADDTAAHQDEGLLGLVQHGNQLVHIAVVRFGDLHVQTVRVSSQQSGQPAVAMMLTQGQGGEVHLLGGDVLQNIDQDGAGTAAAGDGESLSDDVCQLGGVLDQIVALGNGQGDAGDVYLLEGVLADQALAHVDGDEHHGGRIHVGGSNASDQIGGARAGGGEAHAHLAGGAGVAVCRVRGALFMGRQNMTDLLAIAVKLKLIVDVQNCAAGITKDGVNALFQQALHHDLGCGYFHWDAASFVVVILIFQTKAWSGTRG